MPTPDNTVKTVVQVKIPIFYFTKCNLFLWW